MPCTAANVLIHEEGKLQLCDFGVATVLDKKTDKRRTFIGTLHWMPPELWDRDPEYSDEVCYSHGECIGGSLRPFANSSCRWTCGLSAARCMNARQERHRMQICVNHINWEAG